MTTIFALAKNHKSSLFLLIFALILGGIGAQASGVLNSPSGGYLVCVNSKTKVVTHPGTSSCPSGSKKIILGAQGEAGANGLTGAAGLSGKNGVDGKDGKTLWNGVKDPESTWGAPGDMFINSTTKTLFGPKNVDGTWPAGVSMVGPKGDQGPIGLTGAQGPQGLTGAQGPQGLTGAQGPEGLEGPQGVRGITGLTGAQGPEGLTGAQGPQGLTGADGATGPAGPSTAATLGFVSAENDGPVPSAGVLPVYDGSTYTNILSVTLPTSGSYWLSFYTEVWENSNQTNEVPAICGITQNGSLIGNQGSNVNKHFIQNLLSGASAGDVISLVCAQASPGSGKASNASGYAIRVGN
jgi:hypothetical protein